VELRRDAEPKTKGGTLTWKAKMAKKLKRISTQQSASSAAARSQQHQAEESHSSTFGLPLEECVASTSSEVRAIIL